jgi:hypothetical protein
MDAKQAELIEGRLRRIAWIGEIFLDGDAFREVVLTPEELHGDDYMVDHDKFIQLKQVLFKLKRVEPGDLGLVTWRPYGDEMALTIMVDAHPLYSARPGNYPMLPAMNEAMAGRVGVNESKSGERPVLSVYGPIRDSLDNVVGVLELFASLNPDEYRVDRFDRD